MALPELIEIIPPQQPVQAEVTVPGSKSITNRALVLAALAHGEVSLRGALWSEDTQVMVDCLQDLGFMVNVSPDPHEPCNRTITVYGRGGEVPRGGTLEQPLELFVGNAGTAARFLSAMVCLGEGTYRLHGVARMHQRPQAALFQALRELGYQIDSHNDKLPAVIRGGGRRKGSCQVSIEESSQFASALLMGAYFAPWTVKVVGENAEESPYVAMTSKLIEAFPHRGGEFQIEPDASSGSYFLGAGYLMETSDENSTDEGATRKLHCPVQVVHWPNSGWQMDESFPCFLPSPSSISRKDDLGDSIMTAIVIAPLNSRPTQFEELGRLRVQECERVQALRHELTKCGVFVKETNDTLLIEPSEKKIHGAEIETYNDHRMAMCFAILGLKVPGIKIRNPACVKKTFPNFFQKLAAPPPHGLGVTMRDGATGRNLELGELFAD